MKNSKMNFDEILNTNNFIKKPNLFTVENLKEIAEMSPEDRKESISTFCTIEELEELDSLTGDNSGLDISTLIQFAMEDAGFNIDQLSSKAKINKENLKELISGKKMPWKLELEEIIKLINTLHLSIDEFIQGTREKTIIINSRDINISGIQLPRANNITKREQKKAMIEMERQIIVQDELEEREEFIQTLKNLVSR